MSYPTNWDIYCSNASHIEASAYGFVSDTGDVNRFGARFRAAKSFRGVELEGYSDNTEKGYGALCRVLFVWSAFESFLRITGLHQNKVASMLSAHGGTELLIKLKELDNKAKFYDFIIERVNNTHKTELQNFRTNDLCNITYLASAIRHIFAHGHLTPNSNKVDPAICIEICDTLSEYLLKVMDDEFRDRVARFFEEAYGS